MKTRGYARQLGLFAFCLSISACATDGCSCDGFVAQDFPVSKVDKTIPSSGEVRLTPTGLTFLEDNLDTIVGGALGSGMGLDFCIPQNTSSTPAICHLDETCNDGSEGCQLSLTIDSADLDPMPTDTLNVEIVLGGLDETISVEVPGLFGDRDCLLTLQHPNDANLPAKIGAGIPITFTVDQSSPFKDVRIELGDLTLDDSELDFDIDGNTAIDVPLCETVDAAAGLGFIRDALLPVLQDQFEPILREGIDGALCVPCDNGCPTGTTCNTDQNICRYQDDTCPQNPLGISGQLDLGALLADFSETPNAAVDLTVRVADQAIVNDGVTLALRSGYDPVAEALCVPVDPTVRNFTPPPLSPTVTGNTRPDGTPFHFGVGYHKQALEELLWSVWAGGATCLNVGTSSFDLVTTGAFGALLPSVKQLTYGKTSEAYVKIVPQAPPKVMLGANTVVDDGNGSYTINDPLMTIDWKDFDVHIYGFAQDRFTRLLTIRIDLLLPIALAADGMGGLVPLLGDFEDAITNERIIEAGLIAEDANRILDLLPTLIGFALPALGDSLAQPIDLPEFFGFRIKLGPGDITSVDNNTSIAIFGELEVVQSPYTLRSETNIIDSRVDLSHRLDSGLIRPRVVLDMLPVDPTLQNTSAPVEYSYRVDGANWSMFHRSNELVVDHPLLVLPGEHTIEVRGRFVGEPYTVDATPAKTSVVIDWEAPTVEIERDANMITFDGADVVDDATELEFRYKVITGDGNSHWTAWTKNRTIDLARQQLGDRFRLDVEARDRAGNVGKDTQTVTWHAALENRTDGPVPTETNAAPKAGCTSTGGNGPAGLGWIILVAGGLFFSRRRRRFRFDIRLLGLLAILAVSACKCGGDTGEELVCEPACAEGEQCMEGECVSTNQCTTDEDCANGERCNNGECVPAPACEDLCDCGDDEFASCEGSDTCMCVPYCEAGCGEGTFCCYDSNSCEALPDPCAEQVCEPGFGPVVQTDPDADNATCDVKPGTCDCEKLPPLPLGWIGHYAAIDRNGSTTAIAAYNSTYEDLMVGIVDSNLAVTWYFVDGVPASGDIEGALDGPRGGIADKGDDVGRFTSLAIDDAGNLHVFYRDEDNGDLKWAKGTPNGGEYNFDIEVVDDAGDTGFWTSAVHQNGTIHVVYSVFSVDDGNGGYATEFRHLAFDATGSPTDTTAVQNTIVSGPSENACGVECERRDKCIAPIGACEEPTSDCADDCAADGQVCWMGACVDTYERGAVGYTKSFGTNAQLTRTPAGELFLTYWDYTQNSIAYTTFDGSAWASPTLVGAGTGPWASGMIDSDGDVHLAYMEATAPPQLTYANVTDNVTEVVQDGIRDTADWWLVNDIGEDVDLRIATDGTVTLVYQDATAHSLRKATRDATGTWSLTDLAVPGSSYTGAHGFYATMLKLPEAQLAVELVINNQLDPTEAAPSFHE